MIRQKKTTIYQKKDKDTWKKIKKALKDDGIKHVSSGHYFGDSVSPNGIGGMVDPRDFAVGHQVDRDIYYIDVPESEKDAAVEAAKRHGLVPVVEEYKD